MTDQNVGELVVELVETQKKLEWSNQLLQNAQDMIRSGGERSLTPFRDNELPDWLDVQELRKFFRNRKHLIEANMAASEKLAGAGFSITITVRGDSVTVEPAGRSRG